MPLTPATTDKFMKVGNPGTATTLSAPGFTIGNTSITVGSTTNWPTDTLCAFAIDTVTVVAGVATRVPGSYCEFTGIVTGANTIASMSLAYGTSQNYAAGSLTRVYIPVTGTRENALVDGLNVDHNGRGNHKDLTGANQHTVLGLTDVASAVNDLRITNSIAGAPPSMAAEGADTNINALLTGKGTGLVIPKMASPQGYLINGKIVTSVASNNLTVAVQTLDGNTPSATNPVYVRIGNTVRAITGALTKTLNAGTNWFGSGASYFATFEQDYFVYLVWNTTDSAVTLAFSRDPGMRVYSDFSTTNTNYNYFAGTGSAPGATDEAEVVGRFNATLSATAAFNWSIPATSIVINRPIFETRILSFTNSAGAGGTFYYQQRGALKEVWGQTNVVSISGTGFQNTAATLTLPTAFFNTLDSVSATADAVGATNYLGANLLSKSTTSVAMELIQSSGTNGTAPIDVIVRGR